MHKGPVLSSHVVGTSSDVHVPTQGTSSYVHGVSPKSPGSSSHAHGVLPTPETSTQSHNCGVVPTPGTIFILVELLLLL